MFSILSRRCPLLATSCPSFSVCFPCSSPIPGLIWFGSVYLVATAGFVADQLMRENNNNNNNNTAGHHGSNGLLQILSSRLIRSPESASIRHLVRDIPTTPPFSAFTVSVSDDYTPEVLLASTYRTDESLISEQGFWFDQRRRHNGRRHVYDITVSI